MVVAELAFVRLDHLRHLIHQLQALLDVKIARGGQFVLGEVKSQVKEAKTDYLKGLFIQDALLLI